MPTSPEQSPQLADIQKEAGEKQSSGFEIVRTPELEKVVDQASSLAEKIEKDENITVSDILELEKALERMIESDPKIEAKRLFGESYMGPDEIERHFTLGNGEKLFEYTPEQRQEINRMLREKLDDPQIRDLIKRTPKEELQRRFQFFLFPDKFKDGTPVTMKSLYDRFQDEMIRRGLGKLLNYINWYVDEEFLISDSNPLSWKLVSNGNIEGSNGHDAFEETKILRDYLKENDLATAEELEEASDDEIDGLKQLNNQNWQDAARLLSELKINQKYRIDPLEVVFIHAIQKSALTDTSARTAKRSSDGYSVDVGGCVSNGAEVSRREPDYVDDHLGVSISR